MKNWVRSAGKIAWKARINRHFCLYRRQPLLTSEEKSIDKQQHQGKFLLLGKNTKDFCLETSTNRELTSSELEISSLAPCKWNANQPVAIFRSTPSQAQEFPTLLWGKDQV